MARAEWVAEYTSQISATAVMASPIADTVNPTQNARNGPGARSAPSLFVRTTVFSASCLRPIHQGAVLSRIIGRRRRPVLAVSGHDRKPHYRGRRRNDAERVEFGVDCSTS